MNVEEKLKPELEEVLPENEIAESLPSIENMGDEKDAIIKNLQDECKKYIDYLVEYLMSDELKDIQKIDKTVMGFQDLDEDKYFALRAVGLPVNVAYNAIKSINQTPPSTGDVVQSNSFEKANKYKSMPREEFLKEMEKALRGELA